MKARLLFSVPRLVLCVLALGLFACAPPQGAEEEGNFALVLPGEGGGAKAVSAATLAGLSYRLDFSGPGGEAFTYSAGPGTLRLTLGLGTWSVRARAYLPNGILYGTGETSATVEAGKTGEAFLDMSALASWHVAQGGSDSGGDGSAETPFATMDYALAAIRSAYAADWPGKGSASPAPARILVSGVITVGTGTADSMVDISETGVLYATYPPIILVGNGAGTLDAGGVRRVLYANNVDLTLEDGLTLTDGVASNSYASNVYGGGVHVYGTGASFTMTGGTINGNTVTATGMGCSSGGGGVYIYAGTFVMTGGTISANGTDNGTSGNDGHGGGVYIEGGTFTMSGGTISGNHIGDYDLGGGVCVSNGIFNMDGGTISANEGAIGGGGVFVASGGTFNMDGGTISDHTDIVEGGGVFVNYGAFFTMSGGIINRNISLKAGGVHVSGTFTMTGGTISDNKTPMGGYGGGVYEGSGTFTMSGGTITRNTGADQGGGVHVGGGTFTMSGGTISGNLATDYGGGVYIGTSVGGSFTKDNTSGNGSVIYGNDGTLNQNTVGSGNGHAVYVSSVGARNAHAGSADNLDSGYSYPDPLGGWDAAP